MEVDRWGSDHGIRQLRSLKSEGAVGDVRNQVKLSIVVILTSCENNRGLIPLGSYGPQHKTENRERERRWINVYTPHPRLSPPVVSLFDEQTRLIR